MAEGENKRRRENEIMIEGRNGRMAHLVWLSVK